jgi:hemerythrin-like domain-containing protein
MAESRHEAAEEQFFWPVVRQQGPDAAKLAGQAIEQEQEAKHALANLDKLDVTEAGFEPLLTEIINSGHEHIAFEEERVWPLLRQAISAAEAQELGSKIAGAEASGPTRPHPHTPPRAGLLKTAGAAAAAIDRLRDAASGRDAEN